MNIRVSAQKFKHAPRSDTFNQHHSGLSMPLVTGANQSEHSDFWERRSDRGGHLGLSLMLVGCLLPARSKGVMSQPTLGTAIVKKRQGKHLSLWTGRQGEGKTEPFFQSH